MTAHRKKLSICIPVYNGAKSLPASLEALAYLDENFCDIHILDNKSHDDTLKIAGDWKKNSSNIHVHAFSINTGQPGNFNRCVRYAENTFFAWLGAGDQPFPQYYERTISHLENHPECSLCYSADPCRNDLSEYTACTWQERLVKYFRKWGLGNINFGVMRASMAKQLLPWLYLLGNDHIVHVNLLLHGNIDMLPEALFRREWNEKRSFEDYLKTCTTGRPATCPYYSTSFKSLDMLWAYLWLADTCYKSKAKKALFHKILYKHFYLPLAQIIRERIAIVAERIVEKTENAFNPLLSRQLDCLKNFIESTEHEHV